MEFFEKLRKRSKLVQSNFFQKVEMLYEIKIDQKKSRSPILKFFKFCFQFLVIKACFPSKNRVSVL